MTRARQLLALVWSCVAIGCTDDVSVKHVSLAFSERENASAPDAGSLAGFTCAERELNDAGAPEYLVRRALSPLRDGVRALRMTMAVQAFVLDDNPGCRDTKLYNYCGPGDPRCTLLPDSTFCVELENDELGASDTARINRVHAALAALVHDPERGLSRAAYDGVPLDRWLLLRAVGTTEPCADVLGPDHTFDPARLIGCAFTCPVVLSDWSGKLWFDSAASGRCEEDVYACAGPHFSPSPYESEPTQN